MAKPWRPRLPILAGLHEKYQVKTIAARTGRPVNEVVGALIRVWLKFQADATDAGDLPGKTSAWVDAYAGLAGLAAGMAEVQWLEICHDRLTIPSFHDFISKRAVKRFEDADRIAGLRAEASAGHDIHNANIKRTRADKVPAAPKVPAVWPADQVAGFDRFWAAYPRKKAKQAVLLAWKKLGGVSEELLLRMIAAIGRQSRSDQWTKDNGNFIPYPATWLNRRQWEDEDTGGAGKPVLPAGRVPAAEGQYGRKPSYEPPPDSVPPGGTPGLF